MADLAGHTFAGLGETLFGYETAARTGEVDAVHDMRVTTRRLRVALSNFAVCLPTELRREFKFRLEQIADALGRVRDLDVMLEALVSLEAELPEARHTMTADLAVRLQRRRRYHLRKLNAYFDGADFQGLKDALARVYASIGAPSHIENGQTTQDQENLPR